MARLSRTKRLWLASCGTAWIPLVVAVSGLTGFWPVLGVCAAGVLWTIYLFRGELATLTIDVPPDERHQRPYWLILPGLALITFAIYPFVHLYKTLDARVEPLGFEDLLQPYIHDRSLYISDLTRGGESSIVTDKTFEHVTFVGPAVVVVLGDNFLDDIEIDGGRTPIQTIFIEFIPPTSVNGIIGLKGCTIRHAKFRHIQFIGNHEAKEKFFGAIIQVNGHLITEAERQQLIYGSSLTSHP